MIALNSGRLTLFYKPFACLGEIETDAIKMFLDAYSAYLDEVSFFHSSKNSAFLLNVPFCPVVFVVDSEI